MFNSLAVQYLFQTPDCHLFTKTAGCISGCVSGISPVLELGRCVLDDFNIIQQLKALLCKDFDLLLVFFVNMIGGRAFLSPLRILSDGNFSCLYSLLFSNGSPQREGRWYFRFAGSKKFSIN